MPGQPNPTVPGQPVAKTPTPPPHPSSPAANNRPSISAVPNPYPGAKYSYDVVLDKSYLDSLDIDIEPANGIQPQW